MLVGDLVSGNDQLVTICSTEGLRCRGPHAQIRTLLKCHLAWRPSVFDRHTVQEIPRASNERTLECLPAQRPSACCPSSCNRGPPTTMCLCFASSRQRTRPRTRGCVPSCVWRGRVGIRVHVMEKGRRVRVGTRTVSVRAERSFTAREFAVGG